MSRKKKDFIDGKSNLRALLYSFIVLVFCGFLITFYNTFSLTDLEYKFDSVIYDINDNYINGISLNTSVELFLKYFDVENCSIEVIDVDGEELGKDDLVFNGSRTIVYNNGNDVVGSYVNIIKGDFNQDGNVNDSDLKKIGECLVRECSLDEYMLKSLDVDLDNEVHINDLLLLDKAVTLGYTGIYLNGSDMVLQTGEMGRMVASVTPNYGVNGNVEWKSLDTSVVTVDEAGRLVGHNEGSAKVQAITLDGKFMAEGNVIVDNTIQLETYEGEVYIGGDELRVKIKSIDYDDISCSVGDEIIASCSIDGEYLVMKGLSDGNVKVAVTSSKYGEKIFNLKVIYVYLNVMPKYFCVSPNNVSHITVSSFDAGELLFERSDSEIISNAYMENAYDRYMLRIETGSKQGRATLTVRSGNSNSTTSSVVIDVTRISIPEIGKFMKVGEEISTLIAGDNLGDLSCVSEDETKATCRIEGNKLIVTPLAVGEVYIRVYNKFLYNGGLYDCGNALFLAVIQE